MSRVFRPVTGFQRRARFQSLIMVLALAALPLSADTLLVSTFSTNTPPYDPNTGDSWAVGTNNNGEIGVGFQDPFSSSYILTQIEVADNFFTPSTDGGAYDNLNIGLWHNTTNDLNGATQIESWSLTPPSTLFTLNSVLNPVINPTDFYFITESVTPDPTPGATTAEYGWQENNLTPFQIGFFAGTLGTPGSWGPANQVCDPSLPCDAADNPFASGTPAYSVSGDVVIPSAVPEPRGYALLLGAGFAGILLLRRRRSARA